MQRPQYRQGSAIDGVSSLRVHVHDLRNLFAVVASAKYLLERPLAEQKHRTVLEALGKVAAEGMVLTNGLLCDGHACQPEVADAPEALRKLEPMLVALAGAERQIRLEIDETPARVGIARSALEAVLLELVTNALSASAQTIVIRGARRGGRFWVLVSDDGRGFVPSVRSMPRRAGLHGTGLLRIAAAAQAARGRLHVRSKIGQGSVIALSLPLHLELEADVIGAERFSRMPQMAEVMAVRA